MQGIKEYEKKIKWMDYRELIKERDRLESFLREYETGIPDEDPRWKKEDDPDVEYFYSLKYLASVYSCLDDRFLSMLEKKVLAASKQATTKHEEKKSEEAA